MSPLGLPLDFSGPWSIRANDQRILNESDFVNKLATIGGNNNYRIYGDQAYTLTPVVYRPWPKAMLNADRRAFNERMSSVRVCVENFFGLTHNLWPFVVTKSCLRLRASRLQFCSPACKAASVGTPSIRCSKPALLI